MKHGENINNYIKLNTTFSTKTDLQELCGSLFGLSSDLANHDDSLRVGVIEEHVETVQEVGAVEGVTTDADAEGLTEADLEVIQLVLLNNDQTQGSYSLKANALSFIKDTCVVWCTAS